MRNRLYSLRYLHAGEQCSPQNLALDHPQLAGRTISEHLNYFRKLFKHGRPSRAEEYRYAALETVRDYAGLFESAFLVKTMGKWTTSHTDRVYANKKIFLVDTGLKTLVTGPGDLGAKAENAVFMKLSRDKIDCGYFAHSEKEVDFVIGSLLPDIAAC